MIDTGRVDVLFRSFCCDLMLVSSALACISKRNGAALEPTSGQSSTMIFLVLTYTLPARFWMCDFYVGLVAFSFLCLTDVLLLGVGSVKGSFRDLTIYSDLF